MILFDKIEKLNSLFSSWKIISNNIKSSSWYVRKVSTHKKCVSLNLVKRFNVKCDDEYRVQFHVWILIFCF